MNWNEETEVLIIGFGGAGATAAITAHDLGAHVLIVEKMETGGGNTNVSLGGFLNIKDFDQGLLYLDNLCNSVSQMVEPEMIRTFTHECMKNREWIEAFEVSTVIYGGAAFPHLPGSDSIEKLLIKGSKEEGENTFWHLFRTEVEKRQIPVYHNAQAKDIITDTKGRVIGVVILKGEEEISVKINRAVILTCGGFEYNDWMKMNYLKGYPYHSFGSPGNTGDGLRMAQRIGADLWHTSSVSTPLGFKAPEFEAAFMIRPPSNHYIYLDKQGKRFASELAEIHAYNFIVDYFDPHSHEYPRIPCYMIFDDHARKTGAIGITTLGYNQGKYKWSDDNIKEINRGWIISDETLPGLAKKINVDMVSLENTVNRYNHYCKQKHDDDYQRPNDTLEPIGPGPYYSMELMPCLLNTQGGPRRNHKAQILNTDCNPIPRLYSAGELGSIFGMLYQGAGNLGECLAFGRIAGREAANEQLME